MQALNGSRFLTSDPCHVPAEPRCGSSNTGKTIHSLMMSLNVQSPLAMWLNDSEKGSILKAKRHHTDDIKRTFMLWRFVKKVPVISLIVFQEWMWLLALFPSPIRNCNCYLLHRVCNTFQQYRGVFKWTDWESGYQPTPAPNHQCQSEMATCSKDHSGCFLLLGLLKSPVDQQSVTVKVSGCFYLSIHELYSYLMWKDKQAVSHLSGG